MGFLSCKVASPAWFLPPQCRLFHCLPPPPVDLAAVTRCRLLGLETVWWGCQGGADGFCTELTPNSPPVVSYKTCKCGKGSKKENIVLKKHSLYWIKIIQII
jgi:hypothetical protein